MRRRLLLAGAAFSLAVAIWAMHFVGMLAARLPFPVDYLVFPTLLSFLVCVIVVGRRGLRGQRRAADGVRLAAAATVMGVGIFSMHYIGMSALHASAHMHHAPVFVVASMVDRHRGIGPGALAGGRTERPAAADPLGDCVRHRDLRHALYGDGGPDRASRTRQPPSSAPALSTDLLAIVVAVVAFCVSGIFLLILVPDRSHGQRTPRRRCRRPAGDRAALAASPAGRAGHHRRSAELRRGAPMRRSAARAARRAASPSQLPVERDGATHFVAVDDVVAVHANAHYTYVFDGTAKLFCPLAIGDVEARLDSSRFVRVHRSHIVNIDRVVGLKRAGDSGLIELAAATAIPCRSAAAASAG